MRCHQTVLTLVTIFCLAAALHAEEMVAESAEKFIKDWVATVNVNEPDKLLAFYDHSEETEVIVSSGLHYRGYEALERAYRDDFKQVRFYDSTVGEIETRILGDTALVTFEHLFKIQVVSDESRWQIHIRTTTVLHRLENRWKIILEHSSPIHGINRMTRIDD